ncbi:MAG: cytochrome c [Blastocatellia bacterium]|nr:cytochrome c [Blastocatellia bacterium]
MVSKKFAAAFLVAAFAFLGFALSTGSADSKVEGTEEKKSLRPSTEITFSKDVAPIFYSNCVVCHRPDDLAPMSLISYKEARPWARSIKERVATRDMPPWHADPKHGDFANDRRLSQKEIDTIVAWVDQGAKEGDPKDLPKLPEYADGWHIGTPDVVLSMTKEHTVEAEGSDDYLYFTIPTNFKEDKWVRAAEIRPGNKKVVHHVIAFVAPQSALAQLFSGRRNQSQRQSYFITEGTLRRVRADAPVTDDGCNATGDDSRSANRRSGSGGGGTFLAGFAPGKDWDYWPEGTAKKIPAGSMIVFQMHYSKTTGKPETDRSSIGLIFAKSPPEKTVVTTGISNILFRVPPGEGNHEVTSCQTLDRDVEIYSYMPHMHLRGKDMKYEAVFPDGRRETLIWVPNYSFSWQTVYKLKKPLTLPKGTKLIVTAHFDNSPKNKYNPDPSKSVRWGDPTYDEMMIGWIEYLTANAKPDIASKEGEK